MIYDIYDCSGHTHADYGGHDGDALGGHDGDVDGDGGGVQDHLTAGKLWTG